MISDSNQTRNIVVKLIDAIKKTQLELKDLKASYRELVNIIKKLSGNGLKHKFKDDENYWSFKAIYNKKIWRYRLLV